MESEKKRKEKKIPSSRPKFPYLCRWISWACSSFFFDFAACFLDYLLFIVKRSYQY